MCKGSERSIIIDEASRIYAGVASGVMPDSLNGRSARENWRPNRIASEQTITQSQD
jgi:hypothetical protein